MSRKNIVPVILAGGQGTRLRPLTSPNRPKPFLKIVSRYSLFQNTIRRVKDLGHPVVICDARFHDLAQRQLSELHCKAEHIIAEPAGRSTAPAIALAAFLLQGTNSTMLVMPSDHYMSAHNLGDDAARYIDQDMTIYGVRPTKPAVRYGYIQLHDDGRIRRFVEKPDRKTARALIAQGHVYWNTGIFIMKPQRYLELLKRHAPSVFEIARAAYQAGKRQETDGQAVFFPAKSVYESCPALAVDYAIMEHLDTGRLAPLDAVWHDVGCWPDLIRVQGRRLKEAVSRVILRGV